MSLDGVGPGWHAPSMTEPAAVVDHAAHTPYTRPGRFAPLLAALPTDPPALSEVARNVIVHYRSADRQLPQETDDDIDLRWLEDMIATDQRRHGTPLAEHRAPEQRLQGCCRDHTLLCVAALREHGLPARSRLGFAGYFQPGEHADHVVAEVWLEGRWRRFDPEIDAPREALPQPMDMPTTQLGSTGFVTAAQAWVGYRRGEVDPMDYGVAGVAELRGVRFLLEEVIQEVAHRFGDELLLWDSWGRMDAPGTPVTEDDERWTDEIAALLLAADAGDLDAERRLLERYRSDPGLHPGDTIVQASPRGRPPVQVRLRD